MMNMYPYYLVKEANEQDELTYAGNFTQGTSVKPSDRQTEFAAYTKNQQLYINIRCPDYNPDEPESFRLQFDPARSARRPHNLLQINIHSSGRYSAGKMEYDIIRLTPVYDISVNIEKNRSPMEISVVIPLDLIQSDGAFKRAVGFNMFRYSKGSLSKWSGYPSELCTQTLQGCGNFIFIHGLSREETRELVQKIIQDSNNYHTRWEKQRIPEEIYRFVQSKKNGFTLRIKKEDVKSARENANNTPWGKEIKKHIIEIADYWASKSDDELFDMVPVGNPRAMTPSQFFGDPLTGGNRSTLATCLETPNSWYNKETGEWWYPGKKVVNPLTKEEITIEDNGEGFLQPEGFANPYTRCMLVAAYRGYILGTLMARPYSPSISDPKVVSNASGMRYAGAIPYLTYAYLLSDDINYAYKAAILIGRIAELYPYMNGGYHDGSYSDTVHLQEPSTTGTEWKKCLLESYDLIFDHIDQFHLKLQELFNRKPDPDNKPRKQSFDLRTAVEQEMVPYIIYSCELERSGASDWSMRLLELEMETAALIQNGELLNRVLLSSKFSLFSKLINGYYRDGKYAYDSSGYVEGMSVAMMDYPNWAYLFQDNEYFKEPLNLFEDKRFSLSEGIAFYYRYKNGGLSAAVGDTTADNISPIAEERKRGLVPYIAASETLYRRMPSMRSMIGAALAMYTDEELSILRKKAGCSAIGGVHPTFTLLAHGLSKEELDRYRTESVQVQPSYLVEDSEISILRTGTHPRNIKHLVLYGQPTLSHAHGDKLGLWLGAYGTHMLAFGGHYPYIWIGPKIGGWETHSASCNVVLIDGRNQAPSSSMQLEHYEGEHMQIAGMKNNEAYPGSHYERWSMLIRTPDRENAYVLDRFMVSGGMTFDYNTHGLDVEENRVEFEDICQWIPLKGTLAGENVPLYSQPGYGWMKALRKAPINDTVTWEYPYENCRLKITSLNNGHNRELYYCLGEKGGHEMKKSPWDSYVLIRDKNENNHNRKVAFTTIMEPYTTSPYIKKVESMERKEETTGISDLTTFQPAGIEITYADGIYRDVIIYNTDGQKIDFRDSYGMMHTSDANALILRYSHHRLVSYEVLGYTYVKTGDMKLEAASPVWEGIVEDVSLDERKISVRFTGMAPNIRDVKDAVGFIQGDEYKKPSPYYLRNVIIDGGLMTFTTDVTLIRGEEDWQGSEKARVQQGKPVTEYQGRKVIVDVKPGDGFVMRNRQVGYMNER